MTALPLRKESLHPRLDGVQNNLIHLKKFATLPFDEFKQEEVLDRVHHHLRLALEGVFNIAAHILSRIPGARETEYKRMAKKLGDLGIVDAQFSETALAAMAGYRNRLTHFYADVTAKELYDICRDKLGDIETFLDAVAKLIKNPGRFGLKIK